jgi:colanic acid/amylovoran biosynthesis glycosyltransferase
MNIAVVSKNKNKYSETFIHNQVKHLPFKTHYFFGDYLPTMYNNDHLFIPDTFGQGLISLWQRKFSGISREDELKKAITEYIINNEIKVVLANYALSAFPFLNICKAANIPLVVHFHGYTAYRNDIYNKYLADYKRLFKEVDAIVAVSAHMVERLKSIGAPAGKIHHIVYGIEPDLFFPPANAVDNKTVLYVGRFCDTKNPHLVILAFQQLLQIIPEANLIMVGDGELMPACINLVKSLALTDSVIFKGPLSNAAIAEEMRSAAVLVQFSATAPNNDTEGTPLAILEAGLSALPVVAARSGGIPEIITDNDTGHLVNELDTSALTNKMVKALGSRDRSLEMAQKLRQKVLSNYTLDKYITNLSAVLKGVTEGR